MILDDEVIGQLFGFIIYLATRLTELNSFLPKTGNLVFVGLNPHFFNVLGMDWLPRPLGTGEIWFYQRRPSYHWYIHDFDLSFDYLKRLSKMPTTISWQRSVLLLEHILEMWLPLIFSFL